MLRLALQLSKGRRQTLAMAMQRRQIPASVTSTMSLEAGRNPVLSRLYLVVRNHPLLRISDKVHHFVHRGAKNSTISQVDSEQNVLDVTIAPVSRKWGLFQ